MMLIRFRHWLLTTLIALTCGSASSQILYDQTASCFSSQGSALSSRLRNSTNVESADDFVVPAGKIWRPNRVVVRGNRNIFGQPVQVRIYPDNDNIFCILGFPCPDSLPAQPPLCTATGTANPPSPPQPGFNEVMVDLDPNFCALEEGRYWLSVVAVDNLCGIIAPCQNWFWQEAFVLAPIENEDRQWVIRDIGNTSAEVTCSGFGLAGSCQSQPVQPGLCFNLQGDEEDQLAPFAFPQMVSRTVLVGDSVAVDVSTIFGDPNDQALTFSAPQLPPYLSLSTAGLVSGSPSASDAGNDPAFVVRATDTTGLFAEAVVALRIVNPATVTLGDSFGSDERLRCSSGGPLNFSVAGNCGGVSGSACEPIPSSATVINARALVDLSHPQVSDLTLRLQDPNGKRVTLMRQPIFDEDATPPAGVCPQADIKAEFTDFSGWPVERRCASPLAIAGKVEPEQPLADFRNQPASGSWELAVENVGAQPSQINQWCLALQFEATGQPIYPQAERPGSATLVDIRSQSQVFVSGTLNGPRDIAWFLIDQGQDGHQAIDTRITPAPGQVLQSHRWGNEKFAGRDPDLAIGDCSVSKELVYPRFIPSFGRELLRVSGCGDNGQGTFELMIQKDVLGPNVINLPFQTGIVEGNTVDAQTGNPVPLAYLTSSGTSAFSNLVGDFAAALLVGPNEVTVFHPDYLPETFNINVVEGEVVNVATVELMPTSFPAVSNQIIFSNGFE